MFQTTVDVGACDVEKSAGTGRGSKRTWRSRKAIVKRLYVDGNEVKIMGRKSVNTTVFKGKEKKYIITIGILATFINTFTKGVKDR